MFSGIKNSGFIRMTIVAKVNITIDNLSVQLSTSDVVYRRSIENDDGGGEWKAVSNGLPQSEGTIIAILAANPKNKGEFYAINNRGIFCSTNTGLSWREVDVSWSKEYLSQHPWALAVKGQDQPFSYSVCGKVIGYTLV